MHSANAQIEFLLRRALAQAGRLPDGVGGLPKRGRPPKDARGVDTDTTPSEPHEENP